MAMSDASSLESRKVWVPFPNYELCARVFSDFQLDWNICAVLRLLDPKLEIKRRQAHDRMWMGHERELRLYYHYMLTEYKRRKLKPKYLMMEWSSPRPPEWWNNKLFFISQKVNLLRQNLKWYIKHFYVLSMKQWPSGCYYPFLHVNTLQREINKAWEDVFKYDFDNKLKNVGIILAKKSDLNHPNPILHGVEEKIWKKKQKHRRNIERRRKRSLTCSSTSSDSSMTKR